MQKNTSVTLGHHFDSFIANQVKEGRFNSASETIRAGLRLLEEREAKLKALQLALVEGEESGISDYSLEKLSAGLDDLVAPYSNSTAPQSQRLTTIKCIRPYTFQTPPCLIENLCNILGLDGINYRELITGWNNEGSPHFNQFVRVAPEVIRSETIRKIANDASLGGIDLPVLIAAEGKSRGRVALVGLKPLRKSKDFGSKDKETNIFVGTPYAVHCDEYEGRTSIYRTVIDTLRANNLDVYLTDLCKIYLCDEKDNELKFLNKDESENHKAMLRRELTMIKPTITVFMGNAGMEIHKSGEIEGKTMCLPHLSGANRKAWNRHFKCTGQPHKACDKRISQEFTRLVMKELGTVK